jgi:ATP-dependent RNA helicase RhlE
VYGGSGYEKQSRELRRGVDIIVATPGRLTDLVENKICDISAIEILVLDEADRLLDMGFMPQVRKIIRKLTTERQTLMFSATIDERVKHLASEFQQNPITVKANTKHVEPSEIEQKMFHVNEFSKDALLAQLVQEANVESVIVFTRTRRRATWVKSRLREANVMAEEIHGEISQAQRERTLAQYRDGAFSVLVATDVAARGLDIPSISHVINYDLPDSPEDYVHRIGRTGRAGRAGIALSFVSEEQRHLIRDIEKITGRVLDPNGPAKKTAVMKRSMPQRRRRFV